MCAVDISADGKMLVTCGVRHVKFWALSEFHGDRVRGAVADVGLTPATHGL